MKTTVLTPPADCDRSQRRSVPSTRPFIWPVDGVVISAYGRREGVPHDGIDIAAPLGTPVWASQSGEVVFAGEQPGYGLLVILRHEAGLATVYAHNARNCVATGSRVEQGDVIALLGRSGDAGSPVVHFEVRVGQKAVNPRRHLGE